MTDLRKTVRRRAVEPYDHKGRRVVVAFEVGDVIAMKYERSRTWFRAPINRVFRALITWTVETERANKKNRRTK